MADIVKVAMAREWVETGALEQADLVGISGGWIVALRNRYTTKILASKQGDRRIFSTLDAAWRVLTGDLGLSGKFLENVRIDGSSYSTEGLFRPRRPDRSAAMKLLGEDAKYAAFLRDSALEGLADQEPALSSAEAKTTMDVERSANRARIDKILVDNANRV